jgi:hypothetical protein
MERLRRPLGCLGILVALAVVFYLSVYLRWPVERPLVYWTIGDQTLGILVGDGPGLGCAIASVDESSDAVHIHAQCWERVVPVPQEGIFQSYVMEVTLQAPLGTRSVFDGTGHFGDLCPVPWPGGNCHIPG